MVSRSSQSIARLPAAGFTLVELMISIALVVILILGVNTVFQSTTAAVGAGQAFSSAVRDGRAAQTAFLGDLSGAAPDGAFFIIHSAPTYAFRNRADLAGSKLQDPSKIDLNGDGIEGETSVPGENIYPSTYNVRNHRWDVLTFFARSLYQAQTGKLQFTEPGLASSEARVWYGPLRLPDNSYANSNTTSTNYPFPGAGTPSTNPNNYFATDGVLGRVATLLNPNPSASTMCYASGATGGSPLSDSTTVSDGTTTWKEEESRCDLAQTSITAFNTHLTDYLSTGSPPLTWPAAFFLGNGGGSPGTLFECNPFITASSTSATPSPLTPAVVARSTPYFLKSCTQFIVEFAGDFVKQDDDPTSTTYGQVEDLVTTSNGNADGIDFVVDPTTKARRVRWYGLPRNTSGTTTIIGDPSAAYTPSSTPSATKFTAGTATDANTMTDVVPLRDVLAANDSYNVTVGGTPTTKANAAVATLNALLGTAVNGMTPQWIERSMPPSKSDYSGAVTATAGMANGKDYLVAWGPDTDVIGIPRPKMIRITITLDDPNGRLSDGQTFQFVYTLP